MIVGQEIQQTQKRFYEPQLTKSVCKSVCKTSNWLIYNLNCGDGRTRTAVQTPHQTAFYTLSLALVFDLGLPSDRLPEAYPLDLSGA